MRKLVILFLTLHVCVCFANPELIVRTDIRRGTCRYQLVAQVVADKLELVATTARVATVTGMGGIFQQPEKFEQSVRDRVMEYQQVEMTVDGPIGDFGQSRTYVIHRASETSVYLVQKTKMDWDVISRIGNAKARENMVDEAREQEAQSFELFRDAAMAREFTELSIEEIQSLEMVDVPAVLGGREMLTNAIERPDILEADFTVGNWTDLANGKQIRLELTPECVARLVANRKALEALVIKDDPPGLRFLRQSGEYSRSGIWCLEGRFPHFQVTEPRERKLTDWVFAPSTKSP